MCTHYMTTRYFLSSSSFCCSFFSSSLSLFIAYTLLTLLQLKGKLSSIYEIYAILTSRIDDYLAFFCNRDDAFNWKLNRRVVDLSAWIAICCVGDWMVSSSSSLLYLSQVLISNSILQIISIHYIHSTRVWYFSANSRSSRQAKVAEIHQRHDILWNRISHTIAQHHKYVSPRRAIQLNPNKTTCLSRFAPRSTMSQEVNSLLLTIHISLLLCEEVEVSASRANDTFAKWIRHLTTLFISLLVLFSDWMFI